MHVHNATREFDFGSLGIFLTPISADTVASLGMVWELGNSFLLSGLVYLCRFIQAGML